MFGVIYQRVQPMQQPLLAHLQLQELQHLMVVRHLLPYMLSLKIYPPQMLQ